jgi:ElaB/YqjD/DUF883 family membrane-anchored ribosome-binding protein
MTERSSMSSSTAWDADVLPSDSGGDAFSDDLTGDPEVDQLVVEIAQTRSEMTDTVEELGERLDPANIAQQAGEKVREATIGNVEAKVEDVTNAASNMMSNAGETVQEAGSGIIETIRRNPIPAAMAGVGLGWLVLNRQSGRSGATSWSRQSSIYGNGRASTGYGFSGDPMSGSRGFSDSSMGSPSLGDRASEVTDAIGGKAQEAGSAVGDAVSSVGQTASQAANNVGQTASQAANTVGQTASQAATQAQRALESNPIAFGAIAVAVGTAVGLALPATQAEKKVMGQAGGQLIDKVETAVQQPLQEMETAQSR